MDKQTEPETGNKRTQDCVDTRFDNLNMSRLEHTRPPALDTTMSEPWSMMDTLHSLQHFQHAVQVALNSWQLYGFLLWSSYKG